MKENWIILLKRIDAMSQRERASIFVLIVMVIVLGIDFFVISPSFERTKLAAAKHFKLTLEEKSLKKELQQIDIDASGSEFNERLRLRTAEYDNVIAPLVEKAKKQLLAPDRVSEFLNDLLPADESVKLTSLKSFQPKAQDRQHGLYRHPFVAEFQGNYLSLMAQVQRIEASPWKLVVDSMSIETDEKKRPNVTLKLHLAAFSDTSNWLSDAAFAESAGPGSEETTKVAR
jgi:Tfp pilus assembly protein PilO